MSHHDAPPFSLVFITFISASLKIEATFRIAYMLLFAIYLLLPRFYNVASFFSIYRITGQSHISTAVFLAIACKVI